MHFCRFRYDDTNFISYCKMLGILYCENKIDLAPQIIWNSYQSHIFWTLHICYLYCIELCQIVCDPCKIRFMLLRSRSRTLHIYPCWFLHWKLRRNMSSAHSKYISIFCHDSLLNMWEKFRLSKRKKEKKFVCMLEEKHERKKEKEEKAFILEFRLKEKNCDKEIEIPPTNFHTHAHLDLIVWLDFFVGSGFWLCKTCRISMLLSSILS